MKFRLMPTITKHSSLFARASVAVLVCTAAVSLASAATINFEAPLRLKPEDSAPALATLPPGSSITALARDERAAEGIDNLPGGWVAIRYSGPITGYVLSKSVGKDFSLRPGAIVRAAPSAEAPLVAMVSDKERGEEVSTEGEWSKCVVRKEMVLFLNSVPPESRASLTEVPPATRPAETAPAVATTPQKPTRPETTAAPPPETKPAPAPPHVVNATPRAFQGTLMRTRRILGRGPKLDYQLVDESNRRIALLDMSALLLTEPLESFEGRMVSIYGPGMAQDGVDDMIIRVETLRIAR